MNYRIAVPALLLLAPVLAGAQDLGTWHREPVTFAATGDEAPTLVGERLWLERDDLVGRRPGIVICHPDPRYGGNMDSHVVRQLATQLAGLGMVSLRFNFRGVGGSQGSFGGGLGEVSDCLGALAELAKSELVDAGRLAVAGYSFGSAVALRASLQDERIRACACVAFPLPPGTADLAPYAYVREAHLPLLFVSGTEDGISSLETIQRLLKLTGTKAETQPVTGADHFFGEEAHLRAMSQDVSLFLRTQLRVP